MKYVAVLGLVLALSACSLNLGAEKLTVDAKTAKKVSKPVQTNDVSASRNDVFVHYKVFA